MRTLILLLTSISFHIVAQTSIDKFAKRLESSLDQLDTSYLSSHIAYDQLFNDILLQHHILNNFNEAFKVNIKGKYALPNQIVQQINLGASYQFINSYTKEESLHLIFRLVTHNGGLNYHDYAIYQKNGKWIINDIYVYMSSENYKETIKRSYLSSLATMQFDSIFWQNFEIDDDYIADLKRLSNAQFNLHTQRLEQALLCMDSINSSLKNEKVYHLNQILLQRRLNQKNYNEAIDAYQLAYPKEASLQLILIEANLIQGNMEKALKAVNQLDKILGVDPYLNYHRANVYLRTGDYQASIDAGRNFHQAFPDNISWYPIRIQQLTLVKNIAECIQLLEEMESKFGLRKYQLDKMMNKNQYLKNSNEYKAWLNS